LHLNLCLFTQSLTKLELEDSKIGNKGAQYLADALKNNTVKFLFSLFISFISNYFVLDRRSLYSISNGMKSKRQELNIWLMLYKTIWWTLFSIDLPDFWLHFHFEQTLTTLAMGSNNIRSKGAQYLADALRNNMVNFFFSLFISFHFYLCA